MKTNPNPNPNSNVNSNSNMNSNMNSNVKTAPMLNKLTEIAKMDNSTKSEYLDLLVDSVEFTHTLQAMSCRSKAGTIYAPRIFGNHKFMMTFAGQRSKNPGTIAVTDCEPYGNNKFYGRISLTGKFSLAQFWQANALDSLESAEEILELLDALHEEETNFMNTDSFAKGCIKSF